MTIQLKELPIVKIGSPFGPTCTYMDQGLMPLGKYTTYEFHREYTWVVCLTFEKRSTGWSPTIVEDFPSTTPVAPLTEEG